MKKLMFLFPLLFAVSVLKVDAQEAMKFKFKPTLSVFESYTIIKNYNIINDGLFDIENSSFNFGFEATQKAYLTPSVFFKFGVRFQHFKKHVYALNQIDGIHHFPHPMFWDLKYSALMIPLHFGNDYMINGKKKGDWYFGLSLGALMNMELKAGVGAPEFESEIIMHSIGVYGDGLPNPAFFWPIAEIGINYIPLKDYDKLSIGLSFEAQLNKTSYSRHTGEIIILATGKRYLYDLHNQSRIFNISGRLSYTF